MRGLSTVTIRDSEMPGRRVESEIGDRSSIQYSLTSYPAVKMALKLELLRTVECL